MKQVFNNSELPHVWAHQQQDSGRVSGGSFYFENKTIYSYGKHFAIARHYNDPANGYAILFTLRSYSNTTAKHISKTWQAIPHGVTVISCAYPDAKDWNNDAPDHAKNFEYWETNIKNLGKSLAKARKKETYLNAIKNEVEVMDKYATYFSLAVPMPLQELIDGLSEANYKEYLSKESERIEAARIEAERVRALQVLEAQKKLKKHLVKWHKGIGPATIYGAKGTTGFDYLRLVTVNIPHVVSSTSKDRPINDTLIETSQGLQFNVSVCKRLYFKILAKLEKGGCDGNCGMTFTDSDYTVKEINKKFVIIGCHKIEMKEIKAIAVKMGWA